MEEIIGEALPAYVQCSLFFIVATGARFSRPASPKLPLRHDGAGAASPKPPGRPSLDSGERNRPAWRPDGERLQHRGRVGSPRRARARLPRLPGPVALAGRLSLPALRRPGELASEERTFRVPRLPPADVGDGGHDLRRDPQATAALVSGHRVHHQAPAERQRPGTAASARAPQLPDRLGLVAQAAARYGAGRRALHLSGPGIRQRRTLTTSRGPPGLARATPFAVGSS